MRFTTLPILIITFCAMVGCQLLNSEDVEKVAQVHTDNEEYVLTDTTFIDITIKNLSTSPIYYSTCDSRTIEELKNGKVMQSLIFTNTCECICLFTIQPNEEKVLSISGNYITQHAEKLELAKEFKYKIYPHFYKDKQQKQRISQSKVSSQEFSLVTQ